MKRFNFFLVSCFLATSMCLMVGCDDNDDPNDPNNAVPDPPGTITANISDISKIESETMMEAVAIMIKSSNNTIGAIAWYPPDNFLLAGNYYDVSICNLGVMSGLGNITKIPTSGFTIPSRQNASVACEAGHGYVVKMAKEDGSDSVYLRLYVVEPIVNTAGGIMGAKVKYQYPFVP
jgi:hypothetical protein